MKITISFMCVVLLGFAALEADAVRERRSGVIKKVGGARMTRAERRGAMADLTNVTAADIYVNSGLGF